MEEIQTGDYCRIRDNMVLPDEYPYKVLEEGKIYQARSVEDFKISLVGIGEERVIEMVGMTDRWYFYKHYFEKVKKS